MVGSRRVAVVIVLLLLVSTSQVAFAYSTGKTGSSTSGCSCHGASASISPSLTGLPWGAGGYTPGATYSLYWDGGPHVQGDGGFNLDASSGTWSNLGTHVKLQNGELTHTIDLSRSWTADWTAPVAGTGSVDFDLAVLYANGNGQTSGDSWGTGTWRLSESSSGSNTPPEVQNISYVPDQPTKATLLSVEYDYFDADGDSEQGTQIRWVLDGLNVSALNDQKIITQDWLNKGQVWECTVTVKDGQDFGNPINLGPIIINNTLPIARNLELNPENPIDTDELILDYEYFDLDGDAQQLTQIRWYLDGARISELDDEDRVNPLMIRSGDQWEASVTPHDGEEFGNTVFTGVVVIGSSNNPPIATAYVSPVGNAKTDDALQVVVGWTDPDGDNVQQTEIRWLRNGIQYSAYNDLSYVLSESTSKGDMWMARVRVSDGLLWSNWVETNSIEILNTPPQVTSIKMLPEGILTANKNLSVVWEQNDIDGDPETNSLIRWWVDGDWIQKYDGWTSIPYIETIRDQSWSVQVIPGDGEDLGTSMKTNSRYIENGPPSIPNIWLGNADSSYQGSMTDRPVAPLVPANSLSPLAVNVASIDLDDEPVLFSISWLRNGFAVPDLENVWLIPAERLEPGQIWTANVLASDPWGLNTSSSLDIEIANTIPQAAYVIDPQPPIAGAYMVIDGSVSNDLDGEVVSWFWTIDDFSYTGQKVSIQLGEGSHSVYLSVVDDSGGSSNTSGIINFENVITINNLEASMSGANVELTWNWNGPDSTFRIYRSTSSFGGDISSSGLPLPSGLEPIGITRETSWSESAPVASILNYVVTAEVSGQEVVWMFELENMVSVNATDAPLYIDSEPTGSHQLLSLPLAIIMLLLGMLSIALTVVQYRRRINT